MMPRWAIGRVLMRSVAKGVEVAGRHPAGLAEPVETLPHQHNITNTDDRRW